MGRKLHIRLLKGKFSISSLYNVLSIVLLLFVGLSITKQYTIDPFLSYILADKGLASASTHEQLTEIVSAEVVIAQNFDEDSQVLGVHEEPKREFKHSVVAYDLRIKALEDVFREYNSPLEPYAKDFIDAADKYGIENWQLIPAIGLAETLGCTTGTTHHQKNCWGWGGADPTRVIFPDYPTAIDTITGQMLENYGNDHLNAKDIQSTYCGLSCEPYGFRWAKGVNYYVGKINTYGEAYGLPRTNEITEF